MLAASLLWEKSSGKVSWLVIPRSLQLRLRTLCFVVRRLALACTLWGLPWLVPCVMARPGECVSCGCDVQWSITAASRAIPGYAGPPRCVCVCVWLGCVSGGVCWVAVTALCVSCWLGFVCGCTGWFRLITTSNTVENVKREDSQLPVCACACGSGYSSKDMAALCGVDLPQSSGPL